MYLKNIAAFLKEKIDSGKVDYAIPREWFPRDYEGTVRLKGQFIYVNPYEFGYSIIRNILSKMEEGKNYLLSLSKINKESSPEWLNESIMYSAHIRSTSAYPHLNPRVFTPIDSEGYTESGTVLKMIFMLPYLKAMGINTIYFLPVTKYSDKFRKGEVGSPYSVKNFFEIDPRYHDTLLDGFSVEEEFKAFMEASHALGIRVILDFIPRTSARDADLILEHPDWFYWIDVSELEDYAPPKIEGLGFELPSKENLEKVYSSDIVKQHLRKFRYAPNVMDPQRWENFVEANKGNQDFLEELVREFKVITPPGFSDWINDSQPTWNDITFLRLYEDHPEEAKKYLDDPKQPPYILFDVIKSSLFPGTIPNSGLWKVLQDIMPYFNEHFGVDGARLDMGHALPEALERQIVEAARKADPAFAIIAEELVMSNDVKAKDSGYNGILGNVWWMEARFEEGKTKELCYEILPKLKLPALAAVETPDTPRACTRKYGKVFSKFMTALNFFLPNTIPFINAGQEIFERQPMNLGLDNSEEGRFVLPPEDPFYGKLAFFDHYVLHWNTEENLCKLTRHLSQLRISMNALLKEPHNLRLLFAEDKHVIGMLYWNSEKGLVIVGNINFNEMKNVTLDLGYYTWRGEHTLKVCMKGKDIVDETWKTSGPLNLSLGPGDVFIAVVE
ncbi:alpha-amylase family glycosyl hydrolase [Kosmotoga sp. DU53]|uniref:alpha-amylase family glycosyl hydrolase n=1 Tax=Kosmotoga sp. DU53 TaxID=1310160 RepID=UPI0007C44474|nr:alpha-amylase family glycosyl hydrolase [Kosmotoga sp. DU53]OAA23765.1 maltodextrin glycosyltransferase [Kosmotoga sp. DU53]